VKSRCAAPPGFEACDKTPQAHQKSSYPEPHNPTVEYSRGEENRRGFIGYTRAQMPAGFHLRKLLAFLCLVVLLTALLTTSTHHLADAAFAPTYLFFGLVVLVRIGTADEEGPYQFAFVSPLACRAPPII
jgi:hypothetical protein